MAGFAILGEMSDDELRDEIIISAKEWLAKLSREEMLRMVVNNRVNTYRARLMKEGNVVDPPGIFRVFE